MPHNHPQPATLTAETRFADERLVVRLAGALMLDQIGTLRELLDGLTRGPAARQIVLDLSGLTCVGAAGLGLILDAHRRLLRRGGFLSLAAPTPAVWQVIRMTQIDGVIPVWATVEEALAPDPALACA